MSISKVVISGRVIKSPEKRFTPNTNVAVTEFAISVESQPRQDGTRESTAVKVIAWRDLAEKVASEISKGDMVAVDGRLQINQYSNAEGQKKRSAEIDAVSVENLSHLMQGSDDSQSGVQKTPVRAGVAASSAPDDYDAIFASDDEIPF